MTNIKYVRSRFTAVDGHESEIPPVSIHISVASSIVCSGACIVEIAWQKGAYRCPAVAVLTNWANQAIRCASVAIGAMADSTLSAQVRARRAASTLSSSTRLADQ
jgi:hypothetical protein